MAETAATAESGEAVVVEGVVRGLRELPVFDDFAAEDGMNRGEEFGPVFRSVDLAP